MRLVAPMVLGLGVFSLATWLWWSGKEMGASLPVERPPIVMPTLITEAGLSFKYDTAAWGFATSKEQLSGKGVVPPCDEGFQYCMYYLGDAYEDTALESAGLRVGPRADLTEKEQCLTMPPLGYSHIHTPPKVRDAGTYATSVFAPIQNAGVGHRAVGALYRFAHQQTCIEFETRVGEARVSSEQGSLTTLQKEKLHASLFEILNTTSLESLNTRIIFPTLDIMIGET